MSFRRTGARLRCESLESRRLLATLTVNTTSDAALQFGAGVDDGTLTLKEALAVVNRSYTPAAPMGDLLQIDTNGGAEPIGTNDRIIFGLEKSAYGDDLSATINLLATEEFGSALIISEVLRILRSRRAGIRGS